MKAKLLRRKTSSHQEVEFQGIPVTVEWRKGSTRTGTGKDGKAWSREMKCDYGYVPGTHAKGDNEDLDVYLGPDSEAPYVWVIFQLKDDGTFDEPKCMLGFLSEESAISMYLAHYPKGWESHIGDIRKVSVFRLRDLVEMAREEDKPTSKTGRFISIDELREVFNTRVLPRPDFQQAIRDFGKGKTWDEMNQDERNYVCVRHGRRKQGEE